MYKRNMSVQSTFLVSVGFCSPLPKMLSFLSIKQTRVTQKPNTS